MGYVKHPEHRWCIPAWCSMLPRSHSATTGLGFMGMDVVFRLGVVGYLLLMLAPIVVGTLNT